MSSLSRGRRSWRARTIMTLVATGIVAGVFAGIAPVALADAGNPILNTIKSSFRVNGDNTVDVFVRGQWNWISHTSDCNFDRAATGAGIIWNDPTEPGYDVGARSATIVASPNGASYNLGTQTVTITTTAAHGFSVGNTVTVSGVKNAFYNGTFTVTAVPTPTTLKYVKSSGTSVANSGNGTVKGAFAGVGIKSLRAGDVTNTIDRMVHPVDRGNVVEGYGPTAPFYRSTTQGYTTNTTGSVPAGANQPTDIPEAWVNPTPPNPNSFASWKGGCGREPLSATASKYAPGGGPLGEATGVPCADGTTTCSAHPWGSWGYETALDGGPGCISSQTGLAQECQGYSHRYASISDVTVACVNFYDVHGGGKFNSGKFQLVNNAGEITVDGNGDNSIDTNAFNVLAGANCTGPVIPARIDHTTAVTNVDVGDAIHDTATLTNVGAKTLYVQFHLYAPGDPTCSGTDLYTGGRKGRTGDGDVTSDDVIATQAGDYHWTAQLYDAQTGGNLLDSTKCGDTGETSHVNGAAIDITKTANPAGPVNAGDDIGFDITVSNAGPGTAKNVVVSDSLPAGADLDWSLAPAFAGCAVNGSVGSQTLDCTFATLGAGSSKGPIHVKSHTTKDDAGTIENTAVVTTSNDGTDQSTASVDVLPAEIHITKTANPAGPVNTGDDIGFDITVSNAGPGTAKNVVVSDSLPAGADLDWSLDPAFAGCAVNGSVGSQTLDCTFATLGAGDSKGPIHVKSHTTKDDAGTIENTAVVTTSNDGTDQSTDSVDVLAPEIHILKEANPEGPVNAGDDIGFDITVSNAGPGTAYDVVVSDSLPAGADLDWSLDPAFAGCAVNGAVGSQTLDCTFATLGAGGSKGPIHVTSSTTKFDAGTIENTAVVTTSNDGTDESTDTVEVQAGNPTADTAQKVAISDYAKVNGLVGGGTDCAGNPDPYCGMVTFELMKNPTDCSDDASVFFTDSVALDPNTGLANTDGTTVEEDGIYVWRVIYHGDNNNNPSPANCSESTQVSGNVGGIIP